jgi:hypothetical protein
VEKQRFSRILSGFFELGTLKTHKNRLFCRPGIKKPPFQRLAVGDGVAFRAACHNRTGNAT